MENKTNKSVNDVNMADLDLPLDGLSTLFEMPSYSRLKAREAANVDESLAKARASETAQTPHKPPTPVAKSTCLDPNSNSYYCDQDFDEYISAKDSEVLDNDPDFLRSLTEDEDPFMKQVDKLVKEAVDQSRRDLKMANHNALRMIAKRLCGNRTCQYMKRDGICGFPARTKIGNKWYCAGDHTRRGKEQLNRAKLHYMEVTKARGMKTQG